MFTLGSFAFQTVARSSGSLHQADFSKWRTLKKKNAHVDKQNSSSDDDDDNDDELHFIVLNVIVNVAFFLASLILGKFSRDVVFVLSLSRALFLSCALSLSVSGNSPLMRRFL